MWNTSSPPEAVRQILLDIELLTSGREFPGKEPHEHPLASDIMAQLLNIPEEIKNVRSVRPFIDDISRAYKKFEGWISENWAELPEEERKNVDLLLRFNDDPLGSFFEWTSSITRYYPNAEITDVRHDLVQAIQALPEMFSKTASYEFDVDASLKTNWDRAEDALLYLLGNDPEFGSEEKITNGYARCAARLFCLAHYHLSRHMRAADATHYFEHRANGNELAETNLELMDRLIRVYPKLLRHAQVSEPVL